MRSVLIALAAAAMILAFAGNPTLATPAVPAGMTTSSHVVLVAQGCGRGWHRGRRGRCVRNWSRAYPCFWVRGPRGRLRMICR